MQIIMPEYMKQSNIFRKKLIAFSVEHKHKKSTSMGVLKMLDTIDGKALADLTFREDFYKWFTKTNGYSTVKLRQLCVDIGYFYWTDLKDSGFIDIFDTVHCLRTK